MRTILFISEFGLSIPIANRMKSSGDKVIVYSNHPGLNQRDGLLDDSGVMERLFIENIYNPKAFKQLARLNPDLVIIDSNYEASVQVRIEFEKIGIPVYGTSLLSKSSLKNKSFIMKIMNMSGIETNVISPYAIPLNYSVVINGGRVISSSIYFEYTRLMNDNIGPEANMGSIGYHGDIAIIDRKIKPFLDMVIKSSFNGKLDLMLKLHEGNLACEGIYFYFGWNNIYGFLENLNLNPSDYFYQSMMNYDMKLQFKSPWSCQIAVGVPPFPYPVDGVKNAQEIKGINSNNLKHIWMKDVTIKDNAYISPPLSGEPIFVTGRGDYIREAKRRAYRTLSNIALPNMMYRTDIGLDTADQCRTLRDWGWLDIGEEALVEPFKTKSAEFSANKSVSLKILV